jgi:hypothetical protein
MSKKKPKISEMRNKAGRVAGLARHSDHRVDRSKER